MSGCQHYDRMCKVMASCCWKQYSCRFCHDESETHIMERKHISMVLCTSCMETQPPMKSCRKCGIVFGKYFCEECRLYDNEEKGQFHCSQCGLCRIGGQENYVHCDGCGCCLKKNLVHKCFPQLSKKNCPMCKKFIHTSREKWLVPSCGHPPAHIKCAEAVLGPDLESSCCPVCKIPNVSSVTEDHRPRNPMDVLAAGRIQSAEASQGGGAVASDGFAARAQRAAQRNFNPDGTPKTTKDQ